MPRPALVALVVLGSFLFLLSGPASAAGKKKAAAKPEPAPAAVEKVLRAEVAGAVDRRGQLAEALQQQPDSAAARWQAGFLKDGDSWRSYDGPARDAASARLLDEYRHRREEAPQTFAGQVDLANWCRKQ